MTNMNPDVRIQFEGSIVLFHLDSDAAKQFVDSNVNDDAPYMGAALAVEARYAQDLAEGMQCDGLIVVQF